jgi:NAD(P)-dependent dehydrogenase (short-subunit alcohol dehydrogenase family)
MVQSSLELSGKVAVVTGANRGIGLEVCKQLAQLGANVILTSRDPQKGKQAQAALANLGIKVDEHQLDVNNDFSPNSLSKYIEQNYGRLDILVNNAGILPDNSVPGEFSDRSILDTEMSIILDAFQTNSLGVIRVCKALAPLMKKNKWGRIVNVSSMMAQLASMDSGCPAYRISKVALNAITRILADELRDFNIQCNSVSPGWVKTEMGGTNANLNVAKGAEAIVEQVCEADIGSTGRFFRNRKEITW